MENKLVTTNLIATACESLHLDFNFVTKNKTVLAIKLPDRIHYIINSNLGLISSTEAHLCIDKAYQYEILNQVVNMPPTISYLDPFSKYSDFAPYKTHQEIENQIINDFSFPMVIKKNTGTEGENIFACNNRLEVKKAIQAIFNLNSYLYDHVLIVQERIDIKNEYRAIFYKNKIELLYKKDNSQAQFIGNLSPLHFTGAKAVDISDNKLLQKVESFVLPVFEKINLSYAGFDIAEDQAGKLWLIEINSVPGYGYYLENNKEKKVVELFKKILQDLKQSF
jgi:glutathione synthase/RimK-type ligase-like ATP-grasp enzyme